MQLVEIFKTNINCPNEAKKIVEQIHATYITYKANFDLDDCDKILRIVTKENIAVTNFIAWLKAKGCDATIFN